MTEIKDEKPKKEEIKEEKKNVKPKVLEFYLKQEAVIRAKIKVEEIKTTDFGSRRYFKIFLKNLVKNPEARKEFFTINYMDRYFNESDVEVKTLLDIPPEGPGFILTTAEKCDNEVREYFYSLFLTGNQTSSNTINELPGEKEEEIQTNPQEREQFFTMLNTHLTQLNPVSLEIRAMSPAEIKEYKQKRRKPGK